MDYIIAIIGALVVYDTLDRIFEAYRERRVRRAARHSVRFYAPEEDNG
jgi:hypothetical protein